ncbi:hypothetical protein [Nitrosomonas sp.]|uniref:hypothetical protein n=1 Tax=Nitrosomonas sp. TaxID=42353 RepID=UPI0025D0B579|nr:hypothetical protein [Nitrosomonas sp.]MBV6447933.1 hypothetical protein [Nitrosomonas sp.]
MGLFDWLTGLFSSKNDEENKASENNVGRDNEQIDVDSKIQDTHEIALEKIESEIQIQASEEANVLRDDEETQRQV